jgi:hypothetical protein
LGKATREGALARAAHFGGLPMTLKQLREKKARLDEQARQLLASINDKTSREDAKRIEGDHSALLAQITDLATQIRAAEDADQGKTKTGLRKKRKARAKNGDVDDESSDDDDADDDDADGESTDDEDESDEDGGDKKGSRKKRKAKKSRAGDEDGEDDETDDAGKKRATGGALTRSQVTEMAVIDTQARGLGVNLDLAGAITKNEGPDAMRKRLFDELAKRSVERGPKGSAAPLNIEFGRDERDGTSVAMEIALITRVLNSRGGRTAIKYEPKHPEELALVEQHRQQAQQYMGMGFVEIAAEAIGFRGNIRTPHKAYEVLQRAFESTSDFPNIFQNVLNKSLLARYELVMPTYREIAIERPFNDFRPHPQIRAGEFPQLQPVSETGELKYGSSADSGENVSVTPYGVVFTISRQMLVNDDLGAIDQLLGSAGDAVLVFENNTFFVMFNSNPVLNQDGLAVFTTGAITVPPAAAVGHNNLVATGSGAAPSVTTIGSARQALRGMKSLTGLYLNIPPRIILTGPAQETAADQMVTAITPTLTSSVNPFSGRLRSVSDANITDTSWYIAAEPGRLPCFVYGFLNGSSGPRVRTFEPFGVQGVKVSLEHDFGCGAIDYRGIFKNAGN